MILIISIVVISGCIDGGMTETTVLDTTEVIGDGGSVVWHLDKGTYHIVITSDVDVNVQITGAGVKENNIYNFDRRVILDKSGSLKIENPTTFGLGKSATTTVTITKEVL